MWANTKRLGTVSSNSVLRMSKNLSAPWITHFNFYFIAPFSLSEQHPHFVQENASSQISKRCVMATLY